MGIACVTCIACITCMACIGRNAAQYGRRCRIESKLLGHQRRLGEQGRQASRRPDGSENWTGREGEGFGVRRIGNSVRRDPRTTIPFPFLAVC